MCIYATREGDHVLFHHEGGVEVGDVDTEAQRLMVAVDGKLTEEQVTEQLLTHVSHDKKEYGHTLLYIHMKCFAFFGNSCVLIWCKTTTCHK